MESNSTQVAFDVAVAPGEKLTLPPEVVSNIGPGRWWITMTPCDAPGTEAHRDHAAFLNSYAPEDEGLYDDYPAR